MKDEYSTLSSQKNKKKAIRHCGWLCSLQTNCVFRGGEIYAIRVLIVCEGRIAP
jgi:hypothetical protein